MKKISHRRSVLSGPASTLAALHGLPQSTFRFVKANTDAKLEAFRRQVNHFSAKIAQQWIPNQVNVSSTCKRYYEWVVDKPPDGLGSIILFTLWMSGDSLRDLLYIMPNELSGQLEFKLQMADYWLDYFAKEDETVWNWFTDDDDLTCEFKLRHVIDLAGHPTWWQTVFPVPSLRHALLQDIFAQALIIQRTPESFFCDLAAEIWDQNDALSIAFVDHVLHKHLEFKRNFIGMLGDDVTEQYDLMKQWQRYKKCHPETVESVEAEVGLAGNRLSKFG